MGDVTHILRHITPERVKALSDHIYSIGAYTHAKEIDDLGHERDMLLQASQKLEQELAQATDAIKRMREQNARLLAERERVEGLFEDARKFEQGHEAAEQSTIRFLKEYLATLRHTEAVADCQHCALNYLISRFIDKYRVLSAILNGSKSEGE